MKTLFAAFLLFYLFAPTLFANGGGYIHGGVAETGSIIGFEPKGTEQIQILDERLNILLQRERASVEIRYILKNHGPDTKVRFGFPVEETNRQDVYIVEETPPQVEKRALEYCKDYTVSVRGKQLDARFEKQPQEGVKADPQRRGIKGWLVSRIQLNAGEECVLNICYTSQYSWSTFAVSGSGSKSGSFFKYRLSTGACWNGPIHQGEIIVNSEGIRTSEVKALKPTNRFKKEGNQWVWRFTDLEPTLADDLEIQAVPGYQMNQANVNDRPERKGLLSFREIEGNWFVLHTNYSVQASSTLPPEEENKYDASNLRENEKAWSEGAPGPGIGEWLELKPEVAQPLRSIEIHPGYASSETKFQANARPRKVEVLLNDEEKFEAILADRNETQTISVPDYNKPVKKIRLTFREVYPGNRFEDLCVSGITLESRLNKKPKIEPVR